MTRLEQALAGTPYLISDDHISAQRFERAATRSLETRDRVLRSSRRIREEASEILEPYLAATRMDLVTESNVIEGIRWDTHAVREVVATHRALLNGPERTLVESVLSDPKVYEVLGLYRAHEIAETWLAKDHIPRATDIRALHELILGSVPGGGQYKLYQNEISGRPDHQTTSPAEVTRVMLEMADWWTVGTDDPLLTATTVHAWLAHSHPFADGNGRLARLLANVELARHDYPPLVVRADDDRGQYYAALAASDDGDLLPLYELFGQILRRQGKIMARPNYVQDVINDRLLASEKQRFDLWSSTLRLFGDSLGTALATRGAELDIQGTLSPASFSLLCERDVAGNGWYAKVRRPGESSEWLLWFGFATTTWMDLVAIDHQPYPAIFVSRRDRSREAEHPFAREFSATELHGNLPQEISLAPAQYNPVLLRTGYTIDELRYDAAAESLAIPLASGL